MNRLTKLFANREGQKLLIPFFTAGYPTFDQSFDLVKAAVDSGASAVEIGIPFSDPLADGPEIQFSSQVALKNGTTLHKIVKAVAELRRTVTVPTILMGYFNPVLSYGVKPFLADASASGVDGLIIPDLTIEEAADFCAEAKQQNVSTIFLVAPTTTYQRMKLIDRMTTGFVYAVTVTGVTGVTGRQKVFDQSTDTYLSTLRRTLKHPFVAGFGVHSPESAVRLCRQSDGVVIGSALIQMIRESTNAADSRKRVAGFLKQVRDAIDD